MAALKLHKESQEAEKEKAGKGYDDKDYVWVTGSSHVIPTKIKSPPLAWEAFYYSSQEKTTPSQRC